MVRMRMLSTNKRAVTLSAMISYTRFFCLTKTPPRPVETSLNRERVPVGNSLQYWTDKVYIQLFPRFHHEVLHCV